MRGSAVNYGQVDHYSDGVPISKGCHMGKEPRAMSGQKEVLLQ